MMLSCQKFCHIQLDFTWMLPIFLLGGCFSLWYGVKTKDTTPRISFTAVGWPSRAYVLSSFTKFCKKYIALFYLMGKVQGVLPRVSFTAVGWPSRAYVLSLFTQFCKKYIPLFYLMGKVQGVLHWTLINSQISSDNHFL